jgi:hypothetical protein
MSNTPTDSGPPNDQSDPLTKIGWLFCAFLPGAVAAICFQAKFDPNWLLPALLALNVACSFFSSFGLLRGMTDKLFESGMALILSVIFFVLNVVIALFVGCSGMGRIAP